MLADLRQALHRIRRHPTFALTIVIVLALGSGAVAVVLAVTQAVILRPFPYIDSQRLAVIWETRENQSILEISLRNYVDWRAQSTSFEELAAFGSVNWGRRMTGRGDPTSVPAAGVSASFFDVLGVAPQLGRRLLASDDRAKAAPVVVLSHGFWQQHFGGDPRVLGSRLTLDGDAFEIVGVMPRAFDFPKGAQLWIPVTPVIDAASVGIQTDALEARWFGVLFVLGRLKPGVSLDQARQELDAINRNIDRATGARPPHAVVLKTFEERMLGNARAALLLLVGAVSLIILIACANVATLLLMRASRMRAETAIRLSIGAAPRHIYRLWAADALVLFLLASAAGLTLAELLRPLVIRLAPDSVYRIAETSLTAPIILAVLAVMVVAALGTAALITALTTMRLRLIDAIRDAGSHATSSRMRVTRRLLVTGEVAVACVLLVGAGLTIRSFVNLRTLDLGFVAEGVLTLNVSPSRENRKDSNRLFYAPLLERIRALPDVIEAGSIAIRPLAHEGVGVDSRALPEGHPIDDTPSWFRFAVDVNSEAVTPGYFGVMRIRLLDGRDFSENDHENAPLVAIISEGTAKRLFPGQRAVGRLIAVGGDPAGPDGKFPWRTIVGVVADVRYRGLQDPRFDFYRPYRQKRDDPVPHLVIRTRGSPLRAIAQVTREARLLDPRALVEGTTTMEDLVDRAVAPWRLNMVLFAVLGVLALATAGVGLYGVVQFAVVERWHEMGIRAALGASIQQLTGLILAEGAILATIGIVLGVAAAWSVARLMSSILFEVAPADAVTFIAAAGTLAAITAAASYIPARTASRVDPSLLLRSLMMILLSATVASAQTPKTGLTRLLESELARFPARVGVYVKHLPTGEEAGVNADEAFSSASVIKIPIMIRAFQLADEHALNLDERVEINRADLRDGTGVLQYHDLGLAPTIRDLITEMVITSDNTATDLMVLKVGGVERLNQWLTASGYPKTKMIDRGYVYRRRLLAMIEPEVANITAEETTALQYASQDNPLFELYAPLFTGARGKWVAAVRDPGNRKKLAELRNKLTVEDRNYWLGDMNPRETGRLLEAIESGTITSKTAATTMRNILRRQQLGARRIPHFIDAPVGHKTGDSGVVANDVGIVYGPSGPVIVAFFTNAIHGPYAEVEDRIGRVSRMIVDYFN